MFVYSEGKTFNYKKEDKFACDVEKNIVLVADFNENRKEAEILFSWICPGTEKSVGAKYENLDGFDRLYINKLERNPESEKVYIKTEIFVNKKHIAVYTEDAELREVLTNYLTKTREKCSNAEVLKEVFIDMFSDDTLLLNEIEDRLATFETEVVENNNKDIDITKKLLTIRKTLLTLNRYYSSMFDLLEDLEENLNSIFTKDEIKHFRIHTNKADRLHAAINHLQEYATQVREAYQSQLDIEQNKVMQLFTQLQMLKNLLFKACGEYLRFSSIHLLYVHVPRLQLFQQAYSMLVRML